MKEPEGHTRTKRHRFFLAAVALFIGIALHTYWRLPKNAPPVEPDLLLETNPPLNTATTLSHGASAPPFSILPSDTSFGERPSKALPHISTEPAPPETQKESENLISFRVINGLAVTQGDIVLGQVEGDFKGSEGITAINPIERWKDPKIPYVLPPSFPLHKEVQEVLTYLNRQSQLQWVPYNGELDAIVFQETKEHCFSFLGKTGGLQPVLLSKKCGFQEILHELLHAVGFIHEHSRTDRDAYVEVLWPQIQSPYESQFKKIPEIWMDLVRDRPFDYQSVMLYPPNSFSKQSQPTLRSKTSTSILPTKKGLSPEDLSRLRELFGY